MNNFKKTYFSRKREEDCVLDSFAYSLETLKRKEASSKYKTKRKRELVFLLQFCLLLLTSPFDCRLAARRTNNHSMIVGFRKVTNRLKVELLEESIKDSLDLEETELLT